MSEYTAEEYRQVLAAVHDMNGGERKEAFGENKLISDYVKDVSASELIKKYRAYVNTPKTGEYWKSTDRRMILVRYIENNIVYYYYCCDGLSSFMSYDIFCKTFTKTERKSQYLESLIKEMEEVNK